MAGPLSLSTSAVAPKRPAASMAVAKCSDFMHAASIILGALSRRHRTRQVLTRLRPDLRAARVSVPVRMRNRQLQPFVAASRRLPRGRGIRFRTQRRADITRLVKQRRAEGSSWLSRTCAASHIKKTDRRCRRCTWTRIVEDCSVRSLHDVSARSVHAISGTSRRRPSRGGRRMAAEYGRAASSTRATFSLAGIRAVTRRARRLRTGPLRYGR